MTKNIFMATMPKSELSKAAQVMNELNLNDLNKDERLKLAEYGIIFLDEIAIGLVDYYKAKAISIVSLITDMVMWSFRI